MNARATAAGLATALATVAIAAGAVSTRLAASGEKAQTAAAAPQTRPATPDGIPARPDDLVFKPLSFTPPDRAKYRRTLAGGVVGYFVEDHELPLVTVNILIRGGTYLDPKGKEGLAASVGSQMRSGGTQAMTPETFDEELDFLAANAGAGFGATQGSASINFLAKDAEKALALFFDMLRTPRFDPKRLDLARAQRLQAIERRNDSTESIEAREWARLMRGTAHFSTAEPTKASLEAITQADLAAFHKQYVHPRNFILAVSGDFKTAELVARLEKGLASWPGAGVAAPPVPAPSFTPVPGVYMVDKPDVNQGRIVMGHFGIQRGNPDEAAIEMMNDLLGGSGFTARITARVRAEEGLAYEAGSSFGVGVYYPGVFSAEFQSKTASCARAATIVIEEIERIRSQKAADGELAIVKSNAIEVFSRYFASASAVAGRFADDELTGRDRAYWTTYRDRIRAVTVDDVQRVAQKYLFPDKLVILAVGNVSELLKGDTNHPQYTFEKLARDGKITRIPLPDPLTLTYPSGQ